MMSAAQTWLSRSMSSRRSRELPQNVKIGLVQKMGSTSLDLEERLEMREPRSRCSGEALQQAAHRVFGREQMATRLDGQEVGA